MAIHSFVKKVETDVTSLVSFLQQFPGLPSGCFYLIQRYFLSRCFSAFHLFTWTFNSFIFLILCFKRKLQNFWEKWLILLKSSMVFSSVSALIDIACDNSKYMAGNNLFSFVQRNRRLCAERKVISLLQWVTRRKLINEFRNATWARTFRQFRKRNERTLTFWNLLITW